MKMTEDKKKKLIIITGPTAAGKTDLSIGLAKLIGGEIISADSMQVYKGMDIGSAKIGKEEMEGVEHHLIDIYDPDFSFNVSEFVKCAKDAIDKILEAGHVPILVGGTAFYIQALLKDVDFSDDSGADESFRALAEEFDKNPCQDVFKELISRYFKELRDIYIPKGDKKEDLYKLLKIVDPESCISIHANNIKRTIRALEYYAATGEKISVHNKRESAKELAYDFIYFVINDDRAKLYERINKRVENMIDSGLLEEVKGLRNKGYSRDLVSMQGIGYKEIFEYLEGKISFDHAVESIKQNTRHFAKRQLTWFRKEEDVVWMNYPEFNYDKTNMLEAMIKRIKDKNIIGEEI